MDKKWSSQIWIHPEVDREKRTMYYPKWSVEPQQEILKDFVNIDEASPDEADIDTEYEYDQDGKLVDYDVDWNYSNGLIIEVKFVRLFTVYMWQIFLPSLLLCIVSTLSTFIPSHLVPGRMSLSVTSFLTLVALFSSARLVIEN